MQPRNALEARTPARGVLECRLHEPAADAVRLPRLADDRARAARRRRLPAAARARRIDAAFGRPRAILGGLGAHAGARAGARWPAPRHETIHDFGGFDPRLYALRYDAPGAPALADRACRRCWPSAGIAGPPRRSRRARPRHLDAAAATPTRRPTSRCCRWRGRRTGAPAQLFALGRALAPLADEGVLVAGQRQHHAQPAPRLRRRRPARRRRRRAGDTRERGLPRLVRRARARRPTGTALFDYRAQRAARGADAPERRAPAAVLRRRRRGRRGAGGAAAARQPRATATWEWMATRSGRRRALLARALQAPADPAAARDLG
ncbi:MAG: hypothetical protein MZW92_22960 [Comamonadaceae bacterium]|nr:hypothetical protein [Comamonadaceae bacterium]